MKIVNRHVEAKLAHLLSTEPVLVLDGPRTAGKSMVARRSVTEHGGNVLDLDDPADLAAVRDDPVGMLAGPGLVVVDEFQRAAEDVLGAIKSHLNRDGVSPGRYLLTGSTRTDMLPAVSEFLTGRHHRITLLPFSQAEIESTAGSLLGRLLESPESLGDLPASGDSLGDYFERIVRGGFPLAVRRSVPAQRRRWFGDYVSGVLSRAVDTERMRGDGYSNLAAAFRGVASITAQVTDYTHVQRAIAADADGRLPALQSVQNWVDILEQVHLMFRLQSWGLTLRTRVTKSPKVHLVDSGLAAHMLGITASNIHQSTKRDESGHLLETFVITELLKQLTVIDDPVEVGHFRTSDDQEVDLVVETEEGLVFGVEVKRSTRVGAKDLAGLRFLASRLGSRFGGGLVLHPGRSARKTTVEKVFAAPVSSLWAV